jgi:4-carboxymuconolactone decarboxylase
VTAGRRLRPLAPDQLDNEQLAVFEAIAHGPRSRGKQAQPLTDGDGALVGPFNAMLLSGPVGMAVQGLGSALRFGTALTDRERELAILLVAADWQSAFERTAHEALGRTAGLSEEEIATLATGTAPPLSDERELALVIFVQQLLAARNIDDAGYVAAVKALGERCVYELVTIVGHYSTLALHLRVFNGESPGATTPRR